MKYLLSQQCISDQENHLVHKVITKSAPVFVTCFHLRGLLNKWYLKQYLQRTVSSEVLENVLLVPPLLAFGNELLNSVRLKE